MQCTTQHHVQLLHGLSVAIILFCLCSGSMSSTQFQIWDIHRILRSFFSSLPFSCLNASGSCIGLQKAWILNTGNQGGCEHDFKNRIKAAWQKWKNLTGVLCEKPGQLQGERNSCWREQKWEWCGGDLESHFEIKMKWGHQKDARCGVYNQQKMRDQIGMVWSCKFENGG